MSGDYRPRGYFRVPPRHRATSAYPLPVSTALGTVLRGLSTYIQQRIEAQGILFKVKVIGSEIRQQPVS